MEQESLLTIMKGHLFELQNDKNTEVTDDTVISSALDDSDDFGPANSKNVFQIAIGWTLKKALVAFKPWPEDWYSLSVKDLASKLLVFLLLFSSVAFSQVQVTIGAGKTELRDNAVLIGIKYLQSFDSIWAKNQYLFAGKNSVFTINPEADIQFGTEDAFSSINVKAAGMLMTFKTKTVAGYETPNTSKLFHVFPMSFGAETNNLFSAINGIAEVGWVPWYQISSLDIPEVIKKTRIGFFLQGGYKFSVDSTSVAASGGEQDQSLEELDRQIFRAKGSFLVDTKKLIQVNGLQVGIVGSADVWYDFINSCFYHKIEGRGRFYLDATQYIDFIYQKGSGAPLFNKGDQYGVGLTVRF